MEGDTSVLHVQNGTMRDLKRASGLVFSDSETDSDSTCQRSKNEKKSKRQRIKERDDLELKEKVHDLQQKFPGGLPG